MWLRLLRASGIGELLGVSVGLPLLAAEGRSCTAGGGEGFGLVGRDWVGFLLLLSL